MSAARAPATEVCRCSLFKRRDSVLPSRRTEYDPSGRRFPGTPIAATSSPIALPKWCTPLMCPRPFSRPVRGRPQATTHANVEAVGRFFLVRPDSCVSLRQLGESVRLNHESLHSAAASLLASGALTSRRGSLSAQLMSPFWDELRRVEARRGDPVPLLRHAFTPSTGVEAAFVFGSVADGTDGPDSDVDVFAIVESESARAYLRPATEIALILGRPVNTLRYSRIPLSERMKDPRHPAHAVVWRILNGRKIWLVGDEQVLARLLPERRSISS
jgi:predicted nucleotidyltransferase